MMNRWVLYLLFCCLFPIPIQGQDTAEEAIERLRSLRMIRNAKDGYVEGKKLVERFPDNLHLRAWVIHHMAVENTEEAVAAAEEMIASHENSAWSWVALASALDRLRASDRETRKQEVLASRIEAPEPALAFNLKTLKGKQVSLTSLKGKVVAINFWGIWCGWCVEEMPEFQNLYEHYKDDPDVAILTINNDRNPKSVPPWMEKKGYTFPVLLDGGYVNKAGIQGFPTTWFLNREGQIAFLKRGWTKELEEEFGWRIEALRGVEVK